MLRLGISDCTGSAAARSTGASGIPSSNAPSRPTPASPSGQPSLTGTLQGCRSGSAQLGIPPLQGPRPGNRTCQRLGAPARTTAAQRTRVQAGTLQAGGGFAELGRSLGHQIQPGQERAFWREQVEAVASYWTGAGKQEPTGSGHAAHIRAKLTAVIQDLEDKRLLDEAGSDL